MANKEIRDAARSKRIAHWEIAEVLGINESVFSRMLRHELPADEKEKILRAIDTISLIDDDDDDDEEYSAYEAACDLAQEFFQLIKDSCLIVNDEKWDEGVKRIAEDWELPIVPINKKEEKNNE